VVYGFREKTIGIEDIDLWCGVRDIRFGVSGSGIWSLGFGIGTRTSVGFRV